uniref:hypothetical protein n=1 Tax=Microbacterium sp. HSID17254 TaxID=2419509 RepID=UPI001EE8DAD4|nr:hypothetical protein [Microbacterium sp. HSID17254]
MDNPLFIRAPLVQVGKFVGIDQILRGELVGLFFVLWAIVFMAMGCVSHAMRKGRTLMDGTNSRVHDKRVVLRQPQLMPGPERSRYDFEA